MKRGIENRPFLFLWVFILLAGGIPSFVLAQEEPEKTEIEKEIERRTGKETERKTRKETETSVPRAVGSESVSLTSEGQGGRVSLNFIEADLLEVIRVFAQYQKVNYTLHPGVKGSVTIYSAEPIKRENILPVFHQVLRMSDAVAVRSGDIYHIVPIEQGKGLARPARGVYDDSYALQVVPVRYFSAGKMKKILAPFVTPGGEILDVARGNLLIIADLPSNIQRLMQIKDMVDINTLAGMHVEIYQAKEANVEELAEEMAEVVKAHSFSPSTSTEELPARFVPILRNNKLLGSSPN